jgi:DNA-binding transcriptional MocR family regulator
VARLAQIRASYDLASPVLEQMMARWCLDHAGELLPPRLAQLRRHRDEVATALSTRFPDWRFHVPAGGLVLWVEVPSPGATALAAHALDLGLRIAVGPRFTADGTADRWFRLPFHLDQVEVDVLMDLLGQAQERAAARVPSAQKPSVWTA